MRAVTLDHQLVGHGKINGEIDLAKLLDLLFLTRLLLAEIIAWHT